MKLEIVTASIDSEKTKKFWETWMANSRGKIGITHIANSPPMGVVPAFAEGIRRCTEHSPDIIACLHDDLAIHRDGWDEIVCHFFRQHPKCVLLGFGGALGVGRVGMYDEEYDPMSLARHDFRSNMTHAEAHGKWTAHPMQVAVLDGFSLIGRTDFMIKAWGKLLELELIHHAYDVAVGCMARRLGKETWLLPLSCHHHGGMTAVTNSEYLEWAKTKTPNGDAGFWLHAHAQVYREFMDILPFHVEEREEE